MSSHVWLLPSEMWLVPEYFCDYKKALPFKSLVKNVTSNILILYVMVIDNFNVNYTEYMIESYFIHFYFF